MDLARRGFAALLVSAALSLSAAAFAQTTGNIEGTVTDASGGVLPGAAVDVSGAALQGVRTGTTDSSGHYRFPALSPGTYRVTATLSGFTRAQKTATVALDATATVNLQVEVSKTENVTVTGEAPLIDTSSTTSGSSYNYKIVDRLPVERNYAAIVLSQPGVQTDVGETQGDSHLAISIYGTTSAENLYLIDGVNTTNVIKGIEGKSINGEFVQEVEVKTDGYMAEYGRATGGVINVITKSGSNEFHGDVYGYYNPNGLRASNRFDRTPNFSGSGDAINNELPHAGLTLSQNTRSEGGLDLGGFFWKDRVWFFGAYDRVRRTTLVRAESGATQGQDFKDDFLTNLFSAKITANLAEGSTLVASFTSDPETESGAANASVIVPSGPPGTYLNSINIGGTDLSGRFTQIMGAFGVVSLQAGQHEDRFSTKPLNRSDPLVVDRTGVVSGNPDTLTGGYGQVFGPTANNESKRYQYGGNFAGYLGNHEFKLGGDYQKDKTVGSTFYTGGSITEIRPCTSTDQCDLSRAPLYTNVYGDTVPVFFEHRIFTASGTDLTPLASAPFNVPTNAYSLFVQDSWRVLSRLTVNAGIRYDDEKLFGGDGRVAIHFKNEWSPRAGFVFDFAGDGTSKLYGSFGRYYYSIPTDLTVRVFTANTNVYSYNYDPNDVTTQDPAAPRNRLIQVGSFAGEPVDPSIKGPYQDEYTLGVEKALDPTFSLGLKYTYRTLGRTIEDHCDLDYNDPRTGFSSCAIGNPGSNSPLENGSIPSCSNSTNPAEPAGCGQPGVPQIPAKRIFRGIEVVARKSFSNTLWAQASYLYSSLKGNYSGAIREADGQTDPGINADYDYGTFLRNGYGRLDLDRPHQVRIDAAYTAPFGLSVGVGAYARSGLPISRLGYYNSFYPDNVYLDARGTGGRTPTDYEANLNLAYSAKAGPVTITP
jgi:outer membrane receptor protein involved in Fe transport